VDLLFPGGGNLTSLSEVSGESVDSGFDQNKSVFGISILSVSFKMLSDRDGLLDQVVKIFGELRSATYPKVSGQIFSIKNPIPFFLRILRIFLPVKNLTWGIPWRSLKVTPIWEGVKPKGKMRKCEEIIWDTLLGELNDEFNDGRGRESDPLGGSSSERESAGADTFTTRVHTTHFYWGFVWVLIGWRVLKHEIMLIIVRGINFPWISSLEFFSGDHWYSKEFDMHWEFMEIVWKMKNRKTKK